MTTNCHGFHRNMHFYFFAFLIHVLLFTYGYCNIEYNNVEVRKFLNTLKNDRKLTSFQFHPVEISLYTDENIEVNPEYDVNLDYGLNIIRSPGFPRDMNFASDRIETSEEHRKKIEELIEFMKERYTSTNYLYSEMKRIQSQFFVKDKMREMIDYCESPEHVEVKDKILKYFELIKKHHEKELNVWNQPTNNLVINVLKDPFNDGVN